MSFTAPPEGTGGGRDPWSEPATAILALGTALPEHRILQRDVAAWMERAFAAQPDVVRRLRRLYRHTGIEARHTCCTDFLQDPESAALSPARPVEESPTTAQRMQVYEREAPGLGRAAGERALVSWAQRSGESLEDVRQSITHLVVVTCTGFFAPGLDFVLARDLRLQPTVERTLIGFMGCAAAFNGLRTAQQIVRGRPDARVLVVSVELCTLHLQAGAEHEDLVAASLFADGAAAALVAVPRRNDADYYRLDAFHTGMQPDTTTAMVWRVGDHGFALRLSPRIPKHLVEAVPQTLRLLFADERPDFWAIHPGGRAIVERLASRLELRPQDTAASRAVLARLGNVSSATILFVLEEMQRRLRPGPEGSPQPRTGVAMAFGPGLVVEMARLTWVPARQPARQDTMREVAR